MKIFFIVVYTLLFNLVVLNAEFHLNLDFSALDNMVDMVKKMDGLKTLLHSQYKKMPVCSDANISNAKYTNCITKKSDELTKALHLEYKLLLEKYHDDKIFQTKIIEAERSWFQYLDSELAIAFPHVNDADDYGTGLTRCYYEYKNVLLEYQINTLKNFDKRTQQNNCSLIKTKD